ncbi:MAG TPA: c-type cytochrome domain-containing protein [Bacteroidota bacterium]|jgi:hypothetical protein
METTKIKIRMEIFGILLFAAVAGSVFTGAGFGGDNKRVQSPDRERALPPVSFKRDVMPVFRRYCLSCHNEEAGNPSEFVPDSYESVMKNAKHGPVVVAGQPDSSHLLQKMSPSPPFGDPMPLKAKRPFPKDTLQLLWRWIKEGAKNN